jgi:hypothetical protein
MADLESKIDILIKSKAINIDTKDTDRIKHRAVRLLPLSRAEEPKVGDFCRTVVVAKDDSKKELVLHVIFLLDGDRCVFVNHLKCRGYIRDYELVSR